jgi:hypothetical protein
VFAGRVTDVTAGLQADGSTFDVTVIATDVAAELANRYIGAEPWPTETLADRVARIVGAAGLTATLDIRIDAPLDTVTVSKRDVDNQATHALLQGLAAGVDAVLWTAVHATTGPYIWYENIQSRATTGVLADDGTGVIVIVIDPDTNRAPGHTLIPGCEIDADDAEWRRDVTDVLTRVDATWLDQTTDPPTERQIRVDNPAGIDAFGVRSYSAQTPLTAAADATDVADRILARSRLAEWRADGIVWDTAAFPPAIGDPTRRVLELLDGTARIGRAVVFDEVDVWPGSRDRTAVAYLDGGRYTYTAAGWRLGLYTTPPAGLGESGGWETLDPTWTWDQMDPEIKWVDLWGVTGPVTT